jgi:hypothetical protein
MMLIANCQALKHSSCCSLQGVQAGRNRRGWHSLAVQSRRSRRTVRSAGQAPVVPGAIYRHSADIRPGGKCGHLAIALFGFKRHSAPRWMPEVRRREATIRDSPSESCFLELGRELINRQPHFGALDVDFRSSTMNASAVVRSRLSQSSQSRHHAPQKAAGRGSKSSSFRSLVQPNDLGKSTSSSSGLEFGSAGQND